MPATTGVLIQFPFYAAISRFRTAAKNPDGLAVSDVIAHAFVAVNDPR